MTAVSLGAVHTSFVAKQHSKMSLGSSLGIIFIAKSRPRPQALPSFSMLHTEERYRVSCHRKKMTRVIALRDHREVDLPDWWHHSHDLDTKLSYSSACKIEKLGRASALGWGKWLRLSPMPIQMYYQVLVVTKWCTYFVVVNSIERISIILMVMNHDVDIIIAVRNLDVIQNHAYSTSIMTYVHHN